MDLHVVGPLATPEERKAVDAVLDPVIGQASSSWDGAQRDAEAEGRVVRGGHAARGRRDLLLPALEAAPDRGGWGSRGALHHNCRRLPVAPPGGEGGAAVYAPPPPTPPPPGVAPRC